MRAFFRRVCCALIFFQALARSRFIAVLCCVALRLSRAVRLLCRTCCLACVGGARVPRLPAARAATCATCDGELRESNPRPRAPEARILPLDQAPKHIATWRRAMLVPRFCGRCPRALVKSLMLVLRRSPSNRAALFACCVLLLCAFALKQACQVGAQEHSRTDKELSPLPSSSTAMGMPSMS